MPVTADRPAPYAPPKAIIDLITRHRNKGLPSPINAEVLQRASVPDSLIPRTLQALHALDLINEDGSPSVVLEGIRLAPDAEYKQRMVDWLNGAYADALAFVDPATDGEVKVRDAFRNYRPVGQQSRMVTLFTGLFAAAGIGPEKKAATSQGGRILTLRKPRTTPQTTRVVTLAGRGPAGTRHRDEGGNAGHTAGSLPSPISGLLAKLPREGEGWTMGEREKFLAAFEAILDFCYPLIERRQETASTEEGDE